MAMRKQVKRRVLQGFPKALFVHKKNDPLNAGYPPSR